MDQLRCVGLLAGFAAAALPGWAQETLSMDPPVIEDVTLTPGSTIEVSVRAGSVGGITGCTFGLDYDPTVLSFHHSVRGTFFDGGWVMLGGYADPPGHYWLNAAIPGPAYGDQSLVIVTFTVLKMGSTGLTLVAGPESVTGGPNLLSDGIGYFEPDSVSPGYFSNLPVPSPAAVTDLRTIGASDSTITLQWTAPVADFAAGTTAAIAYDLRYADTPIVDEAAFASASSVPDEPSPSAGGALHTFDVTGLASEGTYHFALKSIDVASRRSPLSNSPTGRTSPDTIAPARITDLSVLSSTPGMVTLAWTATGDNGLLGFAAAYDLRYSAAGPPFTEAGFSSAIQAAGEPLPSVGRQTLDVEGLTPGASYQFALRAVDDAGHWSPLSNILEVTLPFGGSRGNSVLCGGSSGLTFAGPGTLMTLLLVAALGFRSDH